MNPLVIFILALVSPFVLAFTLLAPIYGGILGASYLIYYHPGKAHPLAGKLLDVFYIIDVYTTLFSAWLAHITGFDPFTYTTPLLVVPLVSLLFAFWLTGKVARKLKDILHLGMR